MHILLIVIIILICPFAGGAQEKFKGYYEPYIDLGYEVTKNYAHKFTVEERTLWYDNESFKVSIQQIDLSHFSKIKLDDKNALAVGFQYRFEENFVKGEKNELRFTEEYTYSIQPKATEFEFRLRAEQRITSSSTDHRFRYNFAASRSFKGEKIDSDDAYILGDLETLLTLPKTSKPEYEQRIGAGVGWPLNNFIKLELITEYRITNFTQNPGHELFLVTGMKFTL